MSNHYRGPSINASYQVSIHLAEGFQRRRLKCEKLTDDRQRTSSNGKSSHCLWQGELKCQVFSKIYVALTLVFCVVFRLFLCPFSFRHCVVGLSIYGFWLYLWYLQTFFVRCHPMIINAQIGFNICGKDFLSFLFPIVLLWWPYWISDWHFIKNHSIFRHIIVTVHSFGSSQCNQFKWSQNFSIAID